MRTLDLQYDRASDTLTAGRVTWHAVAAGDGLVAFIDDMGVVAGLRIDRFSYFGDFFGVGELLGDRATWDIADFQTAAVDNGDTRAATLHLRADTRLEKRRLAILTAEPVTA